REIESDTLNTLVLSTGMDWRATTILRTYVRYLKQINYPFGRDYVERTLVQNPKLSQMLIDLFIAYHNPAVKDRNGIIKTCKSNIADGLEKVDSLDQDRIIRSIKELINATLRTN